MPSPTADLAYLTPAIGGIGGVIKERPEDFLVEEQPLYQPAGHGEHLYLFIEKRGVTTSDVVRRLAKAFRVGKSDVGYAGFKDKHAVTRQHFSVYLPDPAHDQELLQNVETPAIKLLWIARHANKLRRGHHAGNRFVIRIRQVEPTAVVRAKRVLDYLQTHGAPDYVGEQRFGYRKENHELGRLLLLGRDQELLDLMLGRPGESDFAPARAARQAYDRRDYAAALDAWPHHHRPERQALDALRQGKSPRQAVMGIDATHRNFLVSAMQSAAFNRVLDHRIRAGLFDKLVAGDLAWKHDSRAVFAVDQATANLENAPGGRVEKLQVSPSGPMWGASMIKPAGQVLAWEVQALEELGLSESDLLAPGTPGSPGNPASAPGSRRPMRTILIDPDISGGVDEHGPYVRLSFELPRGSFATVILREIMKSDAYAAAEEPGIEA